MRDSYIELGVGIVGQAIRDWRLESKACNYKTAGNVTIREISRFLRGDFAALILNAIDIDSKDLLENLQKENVKKRLEYVSEGWEEDD